MLENHYRRLEQMYLSAPVNKYYRPTILISKGMCQIDINVNPQSFHAAKAVHGSVYFKMLDDAAFFAVNSTVKDVFVLTGSFEIKLFRPISEGKLISKGELLNSFTNKFEARAKLFDENGNIIGSGKGLFIKSDKTLMSIESYKNL